MSETFFTADLHLGHGRMAEMRGFPSAQEHDDAICAEWSRTVRAGDTVWILGDVAVSKPDEALARIAELPGEKHLVAGNHDPVHPMHRQAHQRRYLEVFASVQAFARRRINKQVLLLSHFPYGPKDHTTEPRFMQYRLPDMGELLLHGHIHSTTRYTSGHEFHVGVDAWNACLVPMSEVAAWMSTPVELRQPVDMTL